MDLLSSSVVPGYQFDTIPDLSRSETRERLSQSAVDGFFAIMDAWQIPTEMRGELLGGMPQSSVYKLRFAGGTLRQDELTRISYLVGIYKALHILRPGEVAEPAEMNFASSRIRYRSVIWFHSNWRPAFYMRGQAGLFIRA